jgi:hypothetical protein
MKRIHLPHSRALGSLLARFLLGVLVWSSGGSLWSAEVSASAQKVHQWQVFEAAFKSSSQYDNPAQTVALQVIFKSPSGATRTVDGFWDGGETWRVRFSPFALGEWSYTTSCSETKDNGLNGVSGRFLCDEPAGTNRFYQHGPVLVSLDGRFLQHADGTPFFWLADTAWNGALLSSAEDWSYYIQERTRQKFTAVQWVATQWRASPNGDSEGRLAFTGKEKIVINPAFFQRLDARVMALSQAGLLNAPVMLWAIGGGSNPDINPGCSLPEDQAILLAKYMVARWRAYPVVWILAGDGDYRGSKAERWKHIGQAVFGDRPHAPVVMHPGGMQWILDDFLNEKWLNICGYQSGHGDDDTTLRWLFAGPPAKEWKKEPARPFINLEPPYEGHLAYQSRQPISPLIVRRACYWSLLCAPTAGVSYGGHGVWGWDDGSKPPIDHPSTGVPLPWKKALNMPAAEQMSHLVKFFTDVDYWRLRPAPQMITSQPGQKEPRKYIAAARTEKGDLAVVYVPEDRMVEVRLSAIPPNVDASWFNPQTGERNPVVAVVNADSVQFATPAEGDWLLLMKSKK